MYAVVATGGKQYRVSKGDRLKIEKVPGKVGDKVSFAEVLLIGGTKDSKVGTPKVEGASVTGTILEQDRDRKVMVYKYKKRKKYRKTQGHRQAFTRVEIIEIQARS